MKQAILWLIATLLCPVPALAADPATLDCVRQQLPQRIAEAIATSWEVTLREETPTLPDDAMSEMVDAANRCRGIHGWSYAETQTAMSFAFADIGLRRYFEVARRLNLDPGRVEQVYRALPPSSRQLLTTTHKETRDSFIAALTRSGLTVSGRERETLSVGIATLLWNRDQFLDAFE